MTTDDSTATCGHCGHQWTYPTPAGRCPREYDHVYEETGGTFRLEISTGNAAFHDDDYAHATTAEIARILRSVATRLEDHHEHTAGGNVYDVNGNNVGRWDVTA